MVADKDAEADLPARLATLKDARDDAAVHPRVVPVAARDRGALADRRVVAPAADHRRDAQRPVELPSQPAAGATPDGVLAPSGAAAALPAPVSRTAAAACLAAFAALLLCLPLLSGVSPLLAYADGFYRAGALVFGGGHVVLPLLEAEAVGRGWVSADDFLAGYGAAQAVPGPLFTFAAYLGQAAGGVVPAVVSLIAVFLPGALLVLGALPFWSAMRARPFARAALVGVNAAVVGVLLAALYDPVFMKGAATPAGFVIALAAYAALIAWNRSPLQVVAGAAALGVLAGALGLA